MKAIKDNFSAQAATYAQFRPVFPPELFDFLLEKTVGRAAAWDVGTGNGQVANVLADHFKKVVATDISEAQLAHAVARENIEYRLERAEKTASPDQFFDLITVGQAIHWFDHSAFYAEVRRVAKPGAVVAVFGYELPEFVLSEINDRLFEFYSCTLDGFWEPERHFIDEKYASLPFPFERIEAPDFWMFNKFQRHEFEGYLSSWSAVKKFEKAKGYNPVAHFMLEMQDIWEKFEGQKAVTPVLLRLGRI